MISMGTSTYTVAPCANNFQAGMTAETSTFRPPSTAERLGDLGLCHNDRHGRPCAGHDGSVLVLGGISYPANGRFGGHEERFPPPRRSDCYGSESSLLQRGSTTETLRQAPSGHLSG